MIKSDKEIEAGAEIQADADLKNGKVPDVDPKRVEIEVNGNKIEMLKGPASGLEIKRAVIKQGVGIKVDFVLLQEMPNGTGKVIGDDDKLVIHGHLSFTAIEPDDNS